MNFLALPSTDLLFPPLITKMGPVFVLMKTSGRMKE